MCVPGPRGLTSPHPCQICRVKLQNRLLSHCFNSAERTGLQGGQHGVAAALNEASYDCLSHLCLLDLFSSPYPPTPSHRCSTPTRLHSHPSPQTGCGLTPRLPPPHSLRPLPKAVSSVRHLWSHSLRVQTLHPARTPPLFLIFLPHFHRLNAYLYVTYLCCMLSVSPVECKCIEGWVGGEYIPNPGEDLAQGK